MNKERETKTQTEVADLNFFLPDGLTCHWQFHNLSAPTDVLLESARSLAQETDQLAQESRLSGEKSSIREVAEEITLEFPQLSINSGKTTFFEQSLTDTSELLLPNWEDISNNYSVTQFLGHTAQESAVIKNFMKDSFHNTDEVSIDVSLHNPQNKIFLITSDSMYVGMFVLIEVPRLKEIQLHSVAGRGSLPSISQEKGKLPILLSGMIQVINQDFNFVDKSISSSAQHYQRVTFSSSGAAPLYKTLGFVESDRGGISIKKKSI